MAYVSTANSGADAFTTSRVLTKPGGVVAGDIGVFYIGHWEAAGAWPTLTGVPGNCVLRGTISIGEMRLLVYLAYLAGETSHTFSWASSHWCGAWSTYFTGRDPGLNLATVPFHSLTGTSATISTTTVTAAAGDDLAWGVDTHQYSGGETHTPPTGFTEVYDAEYGSAGYLQNSAGGSQSAPAGTISGSQNFAVALVALAATGGSAAPSDTRRRRRPGMRTRSLPEMARLYRRRLATDTVAAAPDVTVTPATVTAVAAVPGPTVQAGSVVTPAAVAAVAAIPGPTVQAGGALAQPATVTAVASIPAPTISAGTQVTPATVTAVAAVPAPTIQAGSVVAPGTVTAVAAIPSAAVSAGGSATISPATVNAVAAVPAPALTTSSKVTPAAVAAVATVPAPALQAGSKVTPAAVAAVATIPAPAVQAGTRTTPATVTAVTVIPAPTVRLGVLRVVATVTATAGIPAPVMHTSVLVPAFTVAAVATIPAPTVTTLLPFIPLTDPVTVVRGNDATGRPHAHLAAAAAGNTAATGQRANLAAAAARPNPAEATT